LSARADTPHANRSFNSFESVTAEMIGIETTTYVRNIYNYYVSYRLTLDARASAEKNGNSSRCPARSRRAERYNRPHAPA
jgi:hypothetical protein